MKKIGNELLRKVLAIIMAFALIVSNISFSVFAAGVPDTVSSVAPSTVKSQVSEVGVTSGKSSSDTGKISDVSEIKNQTSDTSDKGKITVVEPEGISEVGKTPSNSPDATVSDNNEQSEQNDSKVGSEVNTSENSDSENSTDKKDSKKDSKTDEDSKKTDVIGGGYSRI